MSGRSDANPSRFLDGASADGPKGRLARLFASARGFHIAALKKDGPIISVVVACARADLRSRLAEEDGIEAQGPCTSPGHLAATLAQQAPDVLLLDKSLFDRSAYESLHELRSRFPAMRILLMVDEAGADTLGSILRDRLGGFVLADCPPDACVKAVRAVHRGELWLPRGLLVKALFDLMQAQLRRGPPADAMVESCAETRLSAREKQTVALLRRGYSNKEIARELGIMEDTVKKHLKSVFAKTGVRRRTLLLVRDASRSWQRDTFPL